MFVVCVPLLDCKLQEICYLVYSCTSSAYNTACYIRDFQWMGDWMRLSEDKKVFSFAQLVNCGTNPILSVSPRPWRGPAHVIISCKHWNWAKIQIYFMENELVSKYQPTSIKRDGHSEGKSGTSRKTSMSRMRGLSNLIYPVRDQWSVSVQFPLAPQHLLQYCGIDVKFGRRSKKIAE